MLTANPGSPAGLSPQWGNMPVAGQIPNNLQLGGGGGLQSPWMNQPVAGPAPYNILQNYQPGAIGQPPSPAFGSQLNPGALTMGGVQGQNMLPWLMGGQGGQQQLGQQFNPQFMNILARYPQLFQQLGLQSGQQFGQQPAQQQPWQGGGSGNASFFA